MDFRFEGLDIWKEAIKIGDELFDIAELAEKQKEIQVCRAIKCSDTKYLK